MPFHKPRAYVLAMPPATECKRRGLDAEFGQEPAEAFWHAWHQDLLPPLFEDGDLDVRLAYGPRTALEYWRSLVRRPGQLCFMPARDLPARWARMVEVGLAATDKVVVAASDVPDLTPAFLQQMMAALDRVDLVICREREDRFWCLGQRRWVPALWEYDFEANAPLPGFAERAKELGLSVELRNAVTDLDGPDAVRALAERLDAARFPKTLAALAALGVTGAA